ncbi:MAG: radical SAM protein [Candidatus Lokiarchaeota archaeon]|nr:radical SAM protein [Candidatus Lokiarchaeota archaeon]
MVDLVRLSIGTAVKLGLQEGPETEGFTTSFLMTYNESGCTANCAFCPQARSASSDGEKLSRIRWPPFDLDLILDKLEKSDFQRVCIQCLNYPQVVDDVVHIIKRVTSIADAPVSVCIQPINKRDMHRLKDAGAERIGIAMDACTEELFHEIKGKKRNSIYRWESHLESLKAAQKIFGENAVTTHLIIGLGEAEEEAVKFIFDMQDQGISVGLFAFTNVRGTSLEEEAQPDIGKYRRIQAIHYLARIGRIRREDVCFENGESRLKLDTIDLKESLSGQMFRTTGCEGCNRPYYNERPAGPLYNYHRPLSQDELQDALAELNW